jgi:hypothetical protein
LSVFSPWSLGIAAPTARDIITLARRQLLLPAELTQGEMTVYRGDSVKRSCAFVMGKMWDEANQTEAVRIDFKTAVNSIGDSVLYSDQRYLLKRSAQTPATQWLYLPALRRVRIVPFQPDDPLLQSHMFFYDLTPIQDFDDYRYHFLDANEQAPVIAGEPLGGAVPVPYQSIIFFLQKKDTTYLITAIQSQGQEREKIARFTEFSEIAPGYFRPQRLEISAEEGRTEFTFAQWTVRPADPQLLIPAHLETQTLTMSSTQ